MGSRPAQPCEPRSKRCENAVLRKSLSPYRLAHPTFAASSKTSRTKSFVLLARRIFMRLGSITKMFRKPPTKKFAIFSRSRLKIGCSTRLFSLPGLRHILDAQLAVVAHERELQAVFIGTCEFVGGRPFASLWRFAMHFGDRHR